MLSIKYFLIFCSAPLLYRIPGKQTIEAVPFVASHDNECIINAKSAFDFGANTWLAVLTSERFLFLDAAMLSSSVDTQSVRLKNVQAISASQGFLFGKIMIDLGSRIIVIDNCLKESVKSMAELGNRWLKSLEEGFVPPKENEDVSKFKEKVVSGKNQGILFTIKNKRLYL